MTTYLIHGPSLLWGGGPWNPSSNVAGNLPEVQKVGNPGNWSRNLLAEGREVEAPAVAVTVVRGCQQLQE